MWEMKAMGAMAVKVWLLVLVVLCTLSPRSFGSSATSMHTEASRRETPLAGSSGCALRLRGGIDGIDMSGGQIENVTMEEGENYFAWSFPVDINETYFNNSQNWADKHPDRMPIEYYEEKYNVKQKDIEEYFKNLTLSRINEARKLDDEEPIDLDTPTFKTHHFKNGTYRFCTTRMERVNVGAEQGIFVGLQRGEAFLSESSADVEAKDKSIEILAIKTAAHGYSNPEAADTDAESTFVHQYRLEQPSFPMNITVYMCQGTSRGKELISKFWRVIGHTENVRMPRINGLEDWEGHMLEDWVPDDPKIPTGKGQWVSDVKKDPIYAPVPLEETILLAPGERRGFLIHTSSEFGIANRWPGDTQEILNTVSDENKHLRLYAMRAMPEAKPFTETQDEKAEVDDFLTVEPGHFIRRRMGHAFVGEIEYRVKE